MAGASPERFSPVTPRSGYPGLPPNGGSEARSAAAPALAGVAGGGLGSVVAAEPSVKRTPPGMGTTRPSTASMEPAGIFSGCPEKSVAPLLVMRRALSSVTGTAWPLAIRYILPLKRVNPSAGVCISRRGASGSAGAVRL